MPAHLRVGLQDRPGALAALTRSLAAAGANVMSVRVIDREQGRAVDDLLLDWPYERPFDAVVRAVTGVDGVRLHGLRHVADPRAETGEADVLRQIVEQPGRGLETVVDALPHLLLADWSALLDRRWPREAVHGSAHCPLPLPQTPAAGDRPATHQQDDEPLLVLPLRHTHLRLLVGRYSAPPFTRGELHQAVALVEAAVAVIASGYRAPVTIAPTRVTARVLEDGVTSGCA